MTVRTSNFTEELLFNEVLWHYNNKLRNIRGSSLSLYETSPLVYQSHCMLIFPFSHNTLLYPIIYYLASSFSIKCGPSLGHYARTWKYIQKIYVHSIYIFNVKGEISNIIVHRVSIYILGFLYNGLMMAHVQGCKFSPSNIWL